ncbi:MAG: lipid-A-disaccharide synthase [Proteobacteria bacterium]|nr:lipid-A-disaccharide synthase [Pseudomonadota bacterium]
MLVAGEASGDQLGAGLARALRRRLGERLRLVGVGGAAMAREGVVSPFDIAQLSILGLFEGLRAYRRVVRLADETAALAARERPDVAVLIDSWGYTLRVAQRLRRLRPELPIVKYVGPQVWASRPGRARTLAGTVDHLLSIHSFDAPHFEREGLSVTFVGNPALFHDLTTADGARFRRTRGLEDGTPLLLVAPGSRPAEVARLAQPFAHAVRILHTRNPGLQFVVPVAETVAPQVRAAVADWPLRPHLVETPSDRADAMKAADVALACSGTLTLELALAGCPMVVAYRLGALTHVVLKRIIRTELVTLFNIAAGREVAPELIQNECTGPKLAAALQARLGDGALRESQRQAQWAALDLMGRGGQDPSEAAAEAVLKLMAERGP